MNPTLATRIEKAATDNGFELELAPEAAWRIFKSSQAPLTVWLTAPAPDEMVAAFSRLDVYKALSNFGVARSTALPAGASGALCVGEIPALHRLLRRAFQLARTLPAELLHVFERQTAEMPRATDAERLVMQRVGQEIFRNGLIDYWDGRCAMTGLAVPELLRASHIKPWADCECDAERLDIFNGLLLAPNLDTVFDRGFITVDDDGRVLVADTLDREARTILGLTSVLRIAALTANHRAYLSWHRTHVFRADAGTNPS